MKTVGWIDVHFHAIPGFYRAAVAAAGAAPARSGGLASWSAEHALELMDRHGIALAILSISAPGVHFGDDAEARRLARRCNEFAAECRHRWPGRFGAFAVLPLPDVPAAIAEIDYAIDTLGLDGIGLYTSYPIGYLGDPQLEPILAHLAERRAVGFVHPIPSKATKAVPLDLPGFVLEYPFETTRAATNLIVRGTLEKYPALRLILAHAGGTLPYLAFRVGESPVIDPGRFGQLKPEDVLRLLGRFWFDVALSPASVRMLEAIGADRVLFGSDWPFAPEATTGLTIEVLDRSPALNEDQRFGLIRDNALALMPKLPATRFRAPS